VRIGGEEVELVTSFDQLRAGLIVWVNPCRRCSGRHRGILVPWRGGATIYNYDDTLSDEQTAAHEMLPKPPCEPRPRRVITPDGVAAGIVYRLVDRTMDAEHMMASGLRKVAKGSHV